MDDVLRQDLVAKAQGALQLQLAFFGVAAGLFDHLEGSMTASELARVAGRDEGYVIRWADAAYASELLERVEEGDGRVRFSLSTLGRAFRRDVPGTMFPLAVQVVLGAHMVERAASLAATGERPGESVLEERASIVPLFGPMLEHGVGALFDTHIVDAVDVFRKVDAEGGLVVDLGCGNGWYLRRLAKRCSHVRGIGLDGIEENIRQATEAAQREGLAERVQFRAGDLHHFHVDEPAAVVAMNRALHHVWESGEAVFDIVREHLAPGGAFVIWEPAWPHDLGELRNSPRFRVMAFQNLSEHVQGNHFLTPDEIAAALTRHGFEPEIHRFVGGSEAVVVGIKR